MRTNPKHLTQTGAKKRSWSHAVHLTDPYPGIIMAPEDRKGVGFMMNIYFVWYDIRSFAPDPAGRCPWESV